MSLFKKKKTEPQTVMVKGIPLVCPVCRNDLFFQRKAQLNSAVSSLLNVDWADKEATCFTCSNCTHILWFGAHK